MTRRPTSPPRRPQPRPDPVIARECGCGGQLYPLTSPGSGGSTLRYYRCENCGQPDYSTLGRETERA